MEVDFNFADSLAFVLPFSSLRLSRILSEWTDVGCPWSTDCRGSLFQILTAVTQRGDMGTFFIIHWLADSLKRKI